MCKFLKSFWFNFSYSEFSSSKRPATKWLRRTQNTPTPSGTPSNTSQENRLIIFSSWQINLPYQILVNHFKSGFYQSGFVFLLDWLDNEIFQSCKILCNFHLSVFCMPTYSTEPHLVIRHSVLGLLLMQDFDTWQWLCIFFTNNFTKFCFVTEIRFAKSEIYVAIVYWFFIIITLKIVYFSLFNI
jgi:hypothetical protein